MAKNKEPFDLNRVYFCLQSTEVYLGGFLEASRMIWTAFRVWMIEGWKKSPFHYAPNHVDGPRCVSNHHQRCSTLRICLNLLHGIGLLRILSWIVVCILNLVKFQLWRPLA